MLGHVVARTRKAILVHSDFMEEPVWLPNSQCLYRYESVLDEFCSAQGMIDQIPCVDDFGQLRVEVKVPQWLITKNGYV